MKLTRTFKSKLVTDSLHRLSFKVKSLNKKQTIITFNLEQLVAVHQIMTFT